MSTASIRIDQTGLTPAGVAGQSRADGLADGSEVTLTSDEPGSLNVFTFEWVPDGDTTAVASLVNHGTYATFTPTAGIAGTYRIRLTVDTGRNKAVQIRTFSILTANLGLRKPALGEKASDKASLENSTAAYVARSETNAPEPSGPFSAGNYGGWYESMMELYDAVDELGGSSSSLESRVDALEAVDVSEDLRLDALEAVNSGARLTALEAVDVSELARLTALEAVNSGARLTALEGYPHSLHIAMGANVYTAQIATYVDLGGCYFDPASDPGSVIFRMVGDFVSTDAASSAKVYLYDMGPGDGTAFVPVRRAVLNIAFANVGKRMKVDQALTKTGAPGVDANQIYNTARVYQARMYLTSSDLAASMYVARVGFKVN